MARRTVRLYGPWKGLNEWPGQASPGEAEDAWNVDFQGDMITSRGGRKTLFGTDTTYPAFPAKAWRFGTTESNLRRKDYTGAVSDGDPATFFELAGLGIDPTYDAIYLGFPFPIGRLLFTMKTGNTVASTASYEYYRSVGNWQAFAGLVDGTIAAGKSFGQSGLVTWTMPTDWVPSSISRSSLPGGFPSIPGIMQTVGDLYWVRIKPGAQINGQIGQITSDLVAAGILFGCNGIFQWTQPNGSRTLILGQDDRDRAIARLFSLDRYLAVLRPLLIAGGIGQTSGPEAVWRFIATQDGILAGNGYCLLFATHEEPTVFRRLPQVPLLSTTPAEAPSTATQLVVFENRIVAVSRENPNEIRWSEPRDAIYDFAGGTYPLGGNHIWYKTSKANVIDPAGGPITGLAPIGTKLIIFTARSTWTMDTIDEVGPSGRQSDADVGCIAPGSIAVGSKGVFFLGSGGVYLHSGGENVLLSKRVEPTFKRLDRFNLRRATAVLYQKKGQYRLHVPLGHDAMNDLVLVYDHHENAWTKYGIPDWVQPVGTYQRYLVAIAYSARDAEMGEDLLEVDYNGAIWQGDYGDVDQNDGSGGGALKFPCLFVSSRVKQEDMSVVTARELFAEYRTDCKSTILVGILRDGTTHKYNFFNRGNPQPGETEQGIHTLSLLDDRAQPAIADATLTAEQRYGVAVLGADVWRSKRWRYGRVSFGYPGRVFQVALLVNAAGANMRVRGFEIDFAAREGKRASPEQT